MKTLADQIKSQQSSFEQLLTELESSLYLLIPSVEHSKISTYNEGPFNNTPTWDNWPNSPGPFDNRPTWDNWPNTPSWGNRIP